MDGSTVLQVPDTVLMRQVRDELVFLDMASEQYFGLDPVGACAIGAIQDGADIDGAVDAVFAEFDAPREAISADIRALVQEMVTKGLLVVTPT